MSILLNQNTAGLLTLPSFFSSAAGVPLTVAFAIKVNTLPTSGFNQFDVMKVDGGTGFSLAAIAQNSSTNHTIRAQTNDGSVSSTASLEKIGAMAGQWVKCVCVFNSNTNKVVYSLDGNGSLMTSAVATSSRPATGEVNLKLLGTWAASAVRVSSMVIYRGVGLTPTQALELMQSDSVNGLTPYAKWNTADAWSGTIQDVSGNNRHITPPGTWIYDTDNPSYVIVPNTPPEIVDDKLQEFTCQIDASSLGAGTISYAISTQALLGTAFVDSTGLVTYTPGASFTTNDSFIVAAINTVTDESEALLIEIVDDSSVVVGGIHRNLVRSIKRNIKHR